jgi:hypothetical protein
MESARNSKGVTALSLMCSAHNENYRGREWEIIKHHAGAGCGLSREAGVVMQSPTITIRMSSDWRTNALLHSLDFATGDVSEYFVYRLAPSYYIAPEGSYFTPDVGAE